MSPLQRLRRFHEMQQVKGSRIFERRHQRGFGCFFAAVHAASWAAGVGAVGTAHHPILPSGTLWVAVQLVKTSFKNGSQQ